MNFLLTHKHEVATLTAEHDRMVEDIILRETLGVPVMTIEGDLPKPLDSRTRLRLEAFAEMLGGVIDGDD